MSLTSAKKYVRSLHAIGYALKHPTLLRKPIVELIKSVYRDGALSKARVLQKRLDQIIDIRKEIKLQSFISREGNVSPFELMSIALLIVHYCPTNLLEIGTFDGTTTLQMALNSPIKATVHTIDLPPGQVDTSLPIAQPDLKFVQDTRKIERKYKHSDVSEKVIQHLGDSTLYDFSRFSADRLVDFCFIDGGHSYECVRSDTEKTLSVLSPKGVVLWHDFDPNCPGVYRYLLELAKSQPLIHIEGTALVCLLPSV